MEIHAKTMNHGILEGPELPKLACETLHQKGVAGQGIEPAWLLTSHVDVTVSYFLPLFSYTCGFIWGLTWWEILLWYGSNPVLWTEISLNLALLQTGIGKQSEVVSNSVAMMILHFLQKEHRFFSTCKSVHFTVNAALNHMKLWSKPN